jgi:endonuclease YncB( thermonuclease family)
MIRQVLIGVIASVAVITTAWAETISGVVVGVADGDTITVLDDKHIRHKVRLAGIDAPEKGQDFGQRSKQNLAIMAHGRQVMVEGHKIDRYGRFVGKVMVGGKDVNLGQIEVGLAWVYRAYEREMSLVDVATYRAAEIAAKGRKNGLWGMSDPQPPWEFRQGRATGARHHLADPDAAVIE